MSFRLPSMIKRHICITIINKLILILIILKFLLLYTTLLPAAAVHENQNSILHKDDKQLKLYVQM